MDEDVGARPVAVATKARVRGTGKVRPKTPVKWSLARERRFLAQLAQSGNVAASVRASGLSDTSVYRRRQKDDGFRARWVEALREGYARLETLLLERALNGVEKPVWHGGKQVGTAREYSDRLALALLAAHRGTVAGVVKTGPVALSGDEVRAEVLRRMGEMRERMRGEV